jgi:hypothetical protein
VVDAVQLNAVGGEVDIASVGEDDLLRCEVGHLGNPSPVKRAAWW